MEPHFRLLVIVAALTATLVSAPAALGAPAVAAPDAVPTQGAVASFGGQQRDLVRDGWGDAKVCAQFSATDLRCYKSDAEFRADAGLAPTPPELAEPAAVAAAPNQYWYDCPAGWACIWEHVNYSRAGRRLQWSETGSYDLAQYNFRDKASSGSNRRNLYAFTLVDFRTGQRDPSLTIIRGGNDPDFTNDPYPYPGTWNDRADRIQL